MTKTKLQINSKFQTSPYTLYLILLYLSIAFFSPVSSALAQTKTNLDIFYSLVDSSVIEVTKQLAAAGDTVSLELNLGESYPVFNNKIIASLHSAGKIVTVNNSSRTIPKVNFVIDNVSTEYGEIFRSGFLGEYLIPRDLSLNGNFLIQNSIYRNFNFSFSDTIKVEEVELVENESFPFTKGKVPSEPFFSGLIEPVIAIGTAALAVILFFTIRSK